MTYYCIKPFSYTDAVKIVLCPDGSSYPDFRESDVYDVELGDRLEISEDGSLFINGRFSTHKFYHFSRFFGKVDRTR